ncbi:MAG: GNAT family N-acetyltransferase [Firmicutes bacterium]|nr:GNAT family N-acetyltransferase [Bacillota bacterium]
MECTLRAWKPEDKEKLAELLNNQNILNNLRDGIPFPYTAEDAEHFIRSMLSADKTQTFAFAITANGETVGSIGAFRGNNIHACTAELGYYIGERFWGKGIATCAVKQICDYIFKNTDIIRIFAEPFARNAASCRVLEKAGFQYEGTLRNNAVKNGSVLDMKLYAILKEDSAVPF